MLRTNSKKARENVDNYIMSISKAVDDFNKNYLCFDYDTTNIDDICKCIWNDYFIPEYVQHNNQFAAGRISLYELFKEWAQGLPCEGLFDYYYIHLDPVEIVAAILEETPEEAAKYTDDQAAELLTRMIYNRITKRVDPIETINKYVRFWR